MGWLRESRIVAQKLGVGRSLAWPGLHNYPQPGDREVAVNLIHRLVGVGHAPCPPPERVVYALTSEWLTTRDVELLSDAQAVLCAFVTLSAYRTDPRCPREQVPVIRCLEVLCQGLALANANVGRRVRRLLTGMIARNDRLHLEPEELAALTCAVLVLDDLAGRAWPSQHQFAEAGALILSEGHWSKGTIDDALAACAGLSADVRDLIRRAAPSGQ